MAIEIRPVSSACELYAVQRQRYAIYIEELGYANPHADPCIRAVTDSLDATGQVLGAFDGEVLAGSVRINFGQFGEYAALECVRRFVPYFPDRMMLITKLVIDRRYRAGTLMGRFGRALYVHARDTHPQTMFGVISCVPSHTGFFRRFGYRPIRETFAHPAAGLTVPMAVALYDRDHFRRIGCPVAKVPASRRRVEPVVCAFLRRRTRARRMHQILKPASLSVEPAVTEALQLYRWMWTARRIDAVERELVACGEAFFHVGAAGHEASACLAPLLTGDDYLHCHYRDKALLLARGVALREFFDSLICNAAGHSAGRQMTRTSVPRP